MSKPITKNQTLHPPSRPPMMHLPASLKPPQQSSTPPQEGPKEPLRGTTPAHPQKTPTASGTTAAAPKKPWHHRPTRTGTHSGVLLRTNPPPTATTPLQRPLPRQPRLSSKTPRKLPGPRRRKEHRPVPTASSSKPPQPPDPPRGSATLTGGPADYPPAPHAEVKPQQVTGHSGFATKPANMFTNSITSTATDNGAHPLRAKGDRDGASCISPKRRTTAPHRAAAAATAGNSRATAAPPARVGGTTHLSLNPRHPSRGQRQIPTPKNVSQTSSTDTCCRETRSPAARSREDRQQAPPKPMLKADKKPSNTARPRREPPQTAQRSRSRANNQRHPLAPPQAPPRRGTAPIRPKQSGQPPNQTSKRHRTSHQTSASPQPRGPQPSLPRSPMAVGKSEFDQHSNRATGVAM